MTDSTFGLGPIGQVLVPVTDAERAAAFYRDVLGIRYLFGIPGMAFLDADGVRLFLSAPESPDFAGRSTLYFRVPDIHAAVDALEGRGAVFVGRPQVVHRDGATELWMCFTKDPDGNNVALMSEVPAGP